MQKTRTKTTVTSKYISAFLLLGTLLFFSGSVLFGVIRISLQRQGLIPAGKETPAMREAANTVAVDWQARYPFRMENLLPEEIVEDGEGGQNGGSSEESLGNLGNTENVENLEGAALLRALLEAGWTMQDLQEALQDSGIDLSDFLPQEVPGTESDKDAPSLLDSLPASPGRATEGIDPETPKKLRDLKDTLRHFQHDATAFAAQTTRQTMQLEVVLENTKTLMPCFQKMLELQAAANRWAGQRDFPGKGIALLNNGYLANDFPDYDRETFVQCAEGLSRFSRWCQSQGIPLLYVQAPFKNAKYQNQFPADRADYTNAMQNEMVRLLRERDVEVLDLRDVLREEMTQKDLDPYSLFFVTDHHWNLRGGLWAARVLADYLREKHGLPLDSAGLSEKHFYKKNYLEWFLGSLGRTATLGYVKPDDFTLYLPYENGESGKNGENSEDLTPYDLEVVHEDKGLRLRGTFWEVMFNHAILEWQDAYQNSVYESILYGNRPLTQIINHGKGGMPEVKIDTGAEMGTKQTSGASPTSSTVVPDRAPRILFIRDSFSLAFAPYFSLLTGEVDLIDVRADDGNFTGSVRTYIQETQPDLVVYLNYAGFKKEIYDLR